MNIEELKTNVEKQNIEIISIDSEKCLSIQKEVEEKYAQWILKKDIIPYTHWYLENIKNEKEKIELSAGDQLEHIHVEQSFSEKNEYKGTIRSTVVDLTPKWVKLATPDNYYLLMGEGNKIFAINKPIYQNEFLNYSLENEKLSFNQIFGLTIAIFALIAILIILVSMVF